MGCVGERVEAKKPVVKSMREVLRATVESLK
jgi:hypothetical protein